MVWILGFWVCLSLEMGVGKILRYVVKVVIKVNYFEVGSICVVSFGQRCQHLLRLTFIIHSGYLFSVIAWLDRKEVGQKRLVFILGHFSRFGILPRFFTLLRGQAENDYIQDILALLDLFCQIESQLGCGLLNCSSIFLLDL